MVDGQQDIPEDLARFIAGVLSTVGHMEALLLLRTSDQTWQGSVIASRLYVPPQDAERIVGDLERRGLVEGSPRQGWRYHPATHDLEAQVERLAELYRTNLVGITRLIHARSAPSGAKDFADAFRFRKDK